MPEDKPTIVFFGTSAFAVPALEALARTPSVHIAAVVTQPDKAVGRTQTLQASPVATVARELGLSLLQPQTLKDGSVTSALAAMEPDLFVVAAYGKIIPKAMLELPKLGSVNLHGSLLPNYRGASPIQTAILEGETTTGVTLMVMDELIDHGSTIALASCPIEATDTSTTLEKKLATIGANLLSAHLPTIGADIAAAAPQDHDRASFTKTISRDDAAIDWMNETADHIERKWRAFQPWPGVFFTWERGGKILRVKVGRLSVASEPVPDVPPGTVFLTKNGVAAVVTRQGAVVLEELQPEGKTMLAGDVFLRGYRDFIGAVLPSPVKSSHS